MNLEKALVDGGVWCEIITEIRHNNRWYSVHVGGEAEVKHDPYMGRERPREDSESRTDLEVYLIQEEDDYGLPLAEFKPGTPEFKKVWQAIRQEAIRRLWS